MKMTRNSIAFPAILFAGLFAHATAAEPVRLMTYNIRYLNEGDGEDHWRGRAEAVAKQIKEADIAGLQEARKEQIDDLVTLLPGYDWYGVGRDDGASVGEFTPIFWRERRFDAVDRDTFWLGPDPSAVGAKAWGANLPRICSWVLLRDRRTAERLLVMNTHFDHLSAEARRNSAALIRRKAREIAGEMPVVLMGDLNSRPESDALRILLDENASGMTFIDSRSADAVTPSGPDGTWNGFQAIQPGQRIDYILLGERRPKVLSHRTLDPKTASGRFASDHLPVMIEVQ